MRIAVVYATSDIEQRADVTLPAGAVVADAVTASGLIERLRLERATLDYAIFGQRASPSTPLEDGDRVELLRPLIVDPKAARRKRAMEKPRRPAVKRSR